VDNKALKDLFSKFGSILSYKVVDPRESNETKHAFVHFETAEAAANAIKEMNDTEIESSKITVAPFERRSDRSSNQFTNVYFANVPVLWSREKVEGIFREFGEITSFIFRGDNTDQTRHPGKGYGFANYAKHESAVRAVEEIPKMRFEEGEQLFVARFQKKRERVTILAKGREQRKRETKSRNVYVKYLDDTINDAALTEMFSSFGPISSAVVVRDEVSGVSRGFGFVCFVNDADATKAIAESQNRVVWTVGEGRQIQLKRPLFVSLAQSRAERMARMSQYQTMIQAQQMPVQPPMFYPNMGMGMGMGMPQHFVYPQMFPKPTIAQTRMNMYPQQPHQQQQQHQQYFNQQRRAPRQQMAPQSQSYRPQGRGAGRGGGGNSTWNRTQNSQAVPAVLPAVSSRSPGQDVSLTSLILNEPPDRVKNILGERLYPMIYKINPAAASKITGMLIEMDPADVLKLLDSQPELEAKVQEAMDVLHASQEGMK
jgi:polyadenylate-binding protein